jgi:hypothetical protein
VAVTYNVYFWGKYYMQMTQSYYITFKLHKTLDCLSAEHLLKCHPIIVSILVILFNLIIYFSYVPLDFRPSYTIPLLKVKDYLSKALDCSDFRGIAVSSVRVPSPAEHRDRAQS